MIRPADFASFVDLQLDDGVTLRAVAVEDAPALATFVTQNHDHLCRFLTDLTDEITDEASAHRHLLEVVESRATRTLLEMHIWDGSRLCGAVRLRDLDWHNRNGKIGYLLGASEQGRGVISRVLTVFLQWAFHTLQLQRIELRCDPRNAPSIRVAKRLGFTYEGIARSVERRGDHYNDVMIFARLSND